VNAVSFASHIIRMLEGDFRTKLGGRMHPLLGASTVNVGRIAGGTQPNIVAETCLLDIDRRTLPNEVDTVGEIERLVAGICSPIDGLSWRVEEMAETSIVPHGPLGTDIGSLLVKSASAACLRNGIDAEPVGVTYWTDGGHLSAAGIETIILGPGDIAHAHGPNERVGHADLIASVGVYRDLVERVLLPS
jgi:acetylornithine deacetylase/succinyl-diaminopimelate desuccinylase-like protein